MEGKKVYKKQKRAKRLHVFPTRPPSNANSLQDREEGHVDVRLVLVHGDEEDGREEQGVQDPPRPAETRGAEPRAAARHGISFYWTTTARF